MMKNLAPFGHRPAVLFLVVTLFWALGSGPALSENWPHWRGPDGQARSGPRPVVRAGRTFELLAENTLDAGHLAATPAISGGTIYLRSNEAQFAIGVTSPRP